MRNTRTLPIQEMRKNKKMREFREYLADNGVVLAMVKFLLSLKQSNTEIENPAQFIQDYFGFYQDEKTQMMEDMRTDMTRLQSEVATKEEELLSLKNDLYYAQKGSQIIEVFKLAEVELLSSKVLVQKLGGNAKFDLDFKMTKQQFVEFATKLIESENLEEAEEKWGVLFVPIKESFGLGADGKPKPPFYAGRLDDANYLKTIEKIREFATTL